MVRVKYRYLISIVSVGVSSGASRGVSHRPAYPGCLALSSPSSSVNSSSSSGDAIIYRAIRRSMQTVHGTFGVGRLMARFRIIYWNPSSGLLIIRALRGLPAEQLTSALTLITSVYDGCRDGLAGGSWRHGDNIVRRGETSLTLLASLLSAVEAVMKNLGVFLLFVVVVVATPTPAPQARDAKER